MIGTTTDLMTIKWIVLGLANGPLEFDGPVWRDASGGIVALPRIGDIVVLNKALGRFSVQQVLWTYGEGILELPTAIEVTLEAWG